MLTVNGNHNCNNKSNIFKKKKKTTDLSRYFLKAGKTGKPIVKPVVNNSASYEIPSLCLISGRSPLNGDEDVRAQNLLILKFLHFDFS